MPRYSKRIYELTAEVMAEARNAVVDDDEVYYAQKEAFDQLETLFIEKFKEDNPRFDSERWLQSIGHR